MQSYVTFILSFMENNLLNILILFSLQRYNNTIPFLLFLFGCYEFLVSHLLYLSVAFPFLYDLILLFGNSVIYEVNKTESPISKLISYRNTFLEFSIFTMICSTMLLFLKLNKISIVIIFVIEWTLLLL